MRKTSNTRLAIACSLAAVLLPLFLLRIPLRAQGSASSAAHPTVTKAEMEQWMKEMSNWGRWGKDDQIGTVNLITPAKRKEAAQLVKEGVPVSLAHDELFTKDVDNPSPFELKMGIHPGTVVDTISVSYHGFTHTHMDALCHFFYNGEAYNGLKLTDVTEHGVPRNSIINFKKGIFTRAVLYDIPRLKGVDYLEPGTHIYPEDLDAWEKKARVKVGKGDVIFIRTGRWARRQAKGAWPTSQGIAGLDVLCLKWLKARDVAMVGSDAAMDVMPSGVEGVTQPIHTVVLIAFGTPIFDNCDLDTLSNETNQRRRWEFLISASPLAIPGGTGSPWNPIAMF